MPSTLRKKAQEEQKKSQKAQKDQAPRDRKIANDGDCTVMLADGDADLAAHLLKNPPAPNSRLLQAAQRYRALIR